MGDLDRSGLLPAAPSAVLELGCGNGAMASQLLAERGHRVRGIDISATAIAWARQIFATAGQPGLFVEGDVRAMPDIGTEAFAMVFDGACLHCLIGTDRGLCLAEVRRILEPDGVFVVSTMCGPPRSAEACEHYDAQRECLLEDGVPARTIRPLPALLAELRQAGFAVVDHRVRHNPWWDHATIVARPA